MIEVATEVGYKKIPGADHSHPAYHYRLTPGEAHRQNKEGGWETIKVDERTCKAAGYTFCLQWVSGRTVALFTHEDRTYAQPIHPDKKTKPRPMKEETNGSPRKGGAVPSSEPRAEGGAVSGVRVPEVRGRSVARGERSRPERDDRAQAARGKRGGADPSGVQASARTVQPGMIKSSPKEEPEQALPRRVKGQRRLKKPLSLLDF